MTCEDTGGFLFDHPCQEAATTACGNCGRQLCEKHAQTHDDQTVRCTRCAGKRVRRKQAVKRRRASGDDSDSWDDDEDSWDPYLYGYSSPYMYGYTHYWGWGVYGHGTWGHEHYADAGDFTEADAAAFTDELGEGFDADVGGS